LEKDVAEGLVDNDDPSAGVEKEGDGFAGSAVIAEAEESVGVRGADNVGVEEGSAVEGGAVDAEDGAVRAEDVGDRS
jgi:hypothetical protein